MEPSIKCVDSERLIDYLKNPIKMDKILYSKHLHHFFMYTDTVISHNYTFVSMF